MATDWILTTRLKNKTSATPQIKKAPKKRPWISVDQTTDMTQKTRTHVLKIPKTTNTIYGENC
jgi:hypothetical protein